MEHLGAGAGDDGQEVVEACRRLLLDGGVLIGSEGIQGERGGGAGRGDELAAGNEATATRATNRDELADTVPIADDGEGLTALQGFQDLRGPCAQITLGDFRPDNHATHGSGLSFAAPVAAGHLPRGSGPRAGEQPAREAALPST
ncbi:hypothetical protein [Streptomyces sp. TS71-3]|uniref:hypothetical protein n=1 Tax=Streptomyces sp. TS71-3 TaxID=2733862 RepID=UPI001B2D5BAC|nr:hypothetical protein Sm713_20600 [Streptomyces sp. TS71-3]